MWEHFFAFFLLSPSLCVFGCFSLLFMYNLVDFDNGINPHERVFGIFPPRRPKLCIFTFNKSTEPWKTPENQSKKFSLFNENSARRFSACTGILPIFALPQLISNRNEFILQQKICLCKHNVLNHVSKRVVSECAFVLHEKCLFNCC